MFDLLELDSAGELADYYLHFGVGFADGRKATNCSEIGTSRTAPSDPPALRLIR